MALPCRRCGAHLNLQDSQAPSPPTRPSAEYLRNMGVDLSKAVTSHPMVLSLYIDRNVMPTVAYLRSMG